MIEDHKVLLGISSQIIVSELVKIRHYLSFQKLPKAFFYPKIRFARRCWCYFCRESLIRATIVEPLMAKSIFFDSKCCFRGLLLLEWHSRKLLIFALRYNFCENFFLKIPKYVKLALNLFLANSNLPTNFQLNVFIFEARASLQIFTSVIESKKSKNRPRKGVSRNILPLRSFLYYMTELKLRSHAACDY